MASGPILCKSYVDGTMVSTIDTEQTEITERDGVWFTTGDCPILAMYINDLTGWPIHCFFADDIPSQHAFIVPREGWRLDVNGLSPAEKHNQRWECAEHRELADQELKDVLRRAAHSGGLSDAHRRAREIAPLLVAQARDALCAPSL